MKGLVPIVSVTLALVILLACGLAPSPAPTDTPRPANPTATKVAAPKATNTPKPKPTDTATPAPTPTGAPDVSFSVDRTRIPEGECVVFVWKVANVKEVYFYQEGDRWQSGGVGGEDSRQACPPASTAYYLRVVKPDDTVDLRQIAIAVDPLPTPTSMYDPLGGTRWQVASYYDPATGGSMVSVLPGISMTVEFGRDGKVSGSAGCNTYNATYVISGNQLAFTPPATSSKTCEQPDGIMQQEATLLTHLAEAGSFDLQGNRLSITNRSGVRVLDLVSQ